MVCRNDAFLILDTVGAPTVHSQGEKGFEQVAKQEHRSSRSSAVVSPYEDCSALQRGGGHILYKRRTHTSDQQQNVVREAVPLYL